MGAARKIWQNAKASLRNSKLDKEAGFTDDFGPSLDKAEDGMDDVGKDLQSIVKSILDLERLSDTLNRSITETGGRIIASKRNATPQQKKDADALGEALTDVKTRLAQLVERLDQKSEVLSSASSGVLSSRNVGDFSFR